MTDSRARVVDAVSLNSASDESLAGLKPATKSMVARREAVLGPAYRLHYEEPLHLTRASGTRLWDDEGTEYLDAYNNVASVGHNHPIVVDAVSKQLRVLNTNTRYLQEGLITFAEDLLSTFDDRFQRLMVTCTGSEANDLALRMARQVTGGTGVLVTEYAYHGATADVASCSPSSGTGVNIGQHVRLVPAPDPRRACTDDIGTWFLDGVARQIADLQRHGVQLAAFVIDSLFSSDGIFPDPIGLLGPVVDIVHQAGGVVIADEVQSGFGRTGTNMWGHQRAQFTPDIVTLGKPMGNGMPIAGVVANQAIIDTFGSEVSYFNTFGGSTAMVAAAQAVLDIVKNEKLMANAHRQGEALCAGMRDSLKRHRQTAEVRGAGLYIGVEFLRSGSQYEPDSATSSFVVNEMRRNRVLISMAGPFGNVLKIRPPLVFSDSDVAMFLSVFDGAIAKAASL